MAAPVNDLFADAIPVVIPIGGAYSSAAISTAEGTFEPGEPQPTSFGIGTSSIWWKYTPIESGTATFDTAQSNGGTGGDTEMAVYTGSSVDGLTNVGSASDNGPNLSSVVTISVTAGVTYYIQVGGYANQVLSIVLSVQGPATVVGVSGISDPRDIPGLLVWCSAEAQAGYADGDNMTLWTDLSGNGNHLVAGSLAATAPKWRSTGGASGGPVVDLSGVSYFAVPQVTGLSAAEAVLTLKPQAATGGHWDMGASMESSHYLYYGTIYDDFGTTTRRQVGASSAGVWQRYRVCTKAGGWTAWVNSAQKFTTATNTVGWPANPRIGLGMSGSTPYSLEAPCGLFLLYGRELTPTERDDLEGWVAANPSGGVLASSAEVPIGRASRSSSARALATPPSGPAPWAGSTLAAPVAGRWWTGVPSDGPSPQFRLLGRALSARAVAPLAITAGATTKAFGRPSRSSVARALTAVQAAFVPDNFANPQPVSIATDGATYTSASISNANATMEPGEPLPTTFPSGKSLWFSYTPSSSGTATFDTQLTNDDTEVAIYTGNSVSTLTKVASDADSGGGFGQSIISNFAVTAGTRYYIQVASYNSRTITAVRLRVTGPATFPEGTHPIGRVSRLSIAREIPAPLSYYPTEVLYDDPEIYWRLEEGPDLLDYSGNGRNGLFNSWEGADGELGQTQLVPGVIGQGQRFDNYEAYYSDPDTYALTVDFTLEKWFNGHSYPLTNLGIFLMLGVGFGQKGIGIRTTSGVAYIYGTWGSSQQRQNLIPAASINDGEWHHLVLTRAGSSVRFYVDGELAYSEDGAAPYTPDSAGWMAVGGFAPQVGDPPSPAYDEMAYYDYALTPARIKRHYDSAIQMGDPPLHVTIPLGRVTPTARLAQPLSPAFLQVAAIGQASRSSTAGAITAIQGAPPGTPAFVPIGRVVTPRAARTFTPYLVFSQAVEIGRASRSSLASALTFSTGLIYVDDFERPDGNAIGSPVLGGPYAFPFGQGFAISSGALKSTGNGTMHLTVPALANFDAEIQVKLVGNRAGFMFRYVDSAQYWVLRWQGSQLLQLLRRGAGGSEVVRGTYTQGISAGAVLRVVAWGRILYVYLDGRLLFVAEDYYTPTGTVGFVWTADTTTLIERVTVKEAIAPPGIPAESLDLDAEAGLLLAGGADMGHIFKGRDARLADEGAMA